MEHTSDDIPHIWPALSCSALLFHGSGGPFRVPFLCKRGVWNRSCISILPAYGDQAVAIPMNGQRRFERGTCLRPLLTRLAYRRHTKEDVRGTAKLVSRRFVLVSIPHTFSRPVVAASLAVVLAGAVAMSQAPQAGASGGLRYVRGYSVQGSWLCYGWSNGAYHCTQRWHRSGSKLISDNPNWVPNTNSPTGSGSGGSGSTLPVSQTTGQPCHETVKWPKSIGQWTVPLGCYAKIYAPNPKSYVSRPSYGYCNWWPEVLHPNMSGSTALHMASHTTPKVGAVIFFSGGVQGASRAGHYAQVVAVAPGGKWVLITEMNFYWRGGGFKRVDYRFIHVGSGVSFRY